MLFILLKILHLNFIAVQANENILTLIFFFLDLRYVYCNSSVNPNCWSFYRCWSLFHIARSTIYICNHSVRYNKCFPLWHVFPNTENHRWNLKGNHSGTLPRSCLRWELSWRLRDYHIISECSLCPCFVLHALDEAPLGWNCNWAINTWICRMTLLFIIHSTNFVYSVLRYLISLFP